MPVPNEVMRWLIANDPANQAQATPDRVLPGMTIKPPTPEEQQAARDVEVQQRGGKLHDTIKIDPFSKGYGDKEIKGWKPPLTKI